MSSDCINYSFVFKKIVSILSYESLERFTYYPTGEIKSFEVFQPSQNEMSYLYEYFLNGQISSFVQLKNGKRHGAYIKYRLNQSVHTRSTWIEGVLNGLFQEFYDNGIRKVAARFENDLKEGSVQWSDPDGNPTEIYEFKKGKLDGECSCFFPSSGVEGTELFDDLRDGTIKLVNKEGLIVKTGRWDPYLEQGMRRGFKRGSLFRRMGYKDGKLDGPVEYYYPNGQIARVRFWSKGVETGSEKKFDEKGQLLCVRPPYTEPQSSFGDVGHPFFDVGTIDCHFSSKSVASRRYTREALELFADEIGERLVMFSWVSSSSSLESLSESLSDSPDEFDVMSVTSSGFNEGASQADDDTDHCLDIFSMKPSEETEARRQSTQSQIISDLNVASLISRFENMGVIADKSVKTVKKDLYLSGTKKNKLKIDDDEDILTLKSGTPTYDLDGNLETFETFKKPTRKFEFYSYLKGRTKVVEVVDPDDPNYRIRCEYYMNQVLALQVRTKDGKKHGIQVRYYCCENSKVHSCSVWVDGMQHGLRQEFYIDGTPKATGYFKHGKQDGLARFWDKDGKLEQESEWKEGIPCGKNMEYKKGVLYLTYFRDETGAVTGKVKYSRSGSKLIRKISGLLLRSDSRTKLNTNRKMSRDKSSPAIS